MCRRQVTAKHTYTLPMWLLHEVTWCIVVMCTLTERAEMAAV